MWACRDSPCSHRGRLPRRPRNGRVGWVLLALSPSHGLFDIVSFWKGEGAIPATAVASIFQAHDRQGPDREEQPTGVGNDRPAPLHCFRMLFTMNAATPTCRA